MRILLFLILFPLLAQASPASEERSFNDIFYGLPSSVREAAFSDSGYSKSIEMRQQSSDQNIYALRSALNPQIADAVLGKRPGFLAEAILVIPGEPGKYSLLDVYNALGKVRDLSGRLYHSHTRQEYVPLFENVTRIESAKKTTPIADPAPTLRIPTSETVYMRLKDVNFGNSYYRGDVMLFQNGLRYSLSNNKSLTYLFIPVIKEEKFITQFYFEPIAEGILVYGLAGVDVSDFFSSRISMPSAISKRLAVIMQWVTEGITGKSG